MKTVSISIGVDRSACSIVDIEVPDDASADQIRKLVIKEARERSNEVIHQPVRDYAACGSSMPSWSVAPGSCGTCR